MDKEKQKQEAAELLLQQIGKTEWVKARANISARELLVTQHPKYPEDYFLFGIKAASSGGVRVQGSIRKDAVTLV